MPAKIRHNEIAPWVRSGAMKGIAKYVEELGLDPVKVVGRDGLKIAEADDPYRKVDLITIHQALQRAAELTQRPNIGLELGLAQELQEWGPFGFLFLNVPTVGELLKDLCRYVGALQSQARYQWFEDETQLRLEYNSNHPELSGWEHDAEITITFIMGMVNDALKSQVTPSHISFEHQPVSSPKEYQRLLQLMPSFGANSNSLCYWTATCQRPIPNANPALYQVMKRHLRDLAEAESEEEQLLNFVRNNISRGLAEHTATLEHIAAEIAIEPRTLQRRLKEEGSSFQKLVDEVRLARAKYFLNKTRLSITQIALELGYAEASVFVRAFKRLAGATPKQYRQQGMNPR